jgi:hypothetical protein
MNILGIVTAYISIHILAYRIGILIGRRMKRVPEWL